MAEPTYRLEKPDFSGPLELLLRLIEKNKVDIYDIPIAEITRQYLEQVETLHISDMETMSGFLIMAATLLEIKARMLVKGIEGTEDEETDPREELAARLTEYKRCRYIASRLRISETGSGNRYFKSRPLPSEFAAYVPPVDLDKLLKGVTAERLRSIYLGLTKCVPKRMPDTSGDLRTIKRDKMSVKRCFERLKSFTRNHRSFTFRELTEDGAAGRPEIVVSFLAVLELMRLGRITVEQPFAGADIRVDMKPGSSLDDIDLDAILDD